MARRYRYKRNQGRLANGEGPEEEDEAEEEADRFPIIGGWTLLKTPMSHSHFVKAVFHI